MMNPLLPGAVRPYMVLTCIAAISMAAVLLELFSRRLFRGNFGVVDPGKVYRRSRRWHCVMPFLGRGRIASILNLGHPRDRHPWDPAQLREARRLGVDPNEVELRYDRRPSREELMAILDVFDSCRYPLLIHCTDGADRTGLASALYLMTFAGMPPVRAARESLTLQYGQIQMFGIYKLHEPIREYSEWLQDHERPHSPELFRSWLASSYSSRPEESNAGPREPQPN